MNSDFMKRYVERVLAGAAANPPLQLALQLKYAELDRQATDRAYALARTSRNPEGDLALLAGALDILDGSVPADLSGISFHNLHVNLMSAGFQPGREFPRAAVELVQRIDAAAPAAA